MDYNQNLNQIAEALKCHYLHITPHILDNKIVSEDEIKSINQEIKSKIAEIVQFAKNSPEPEEEGIFDHIYQ